MELLKIIHTVLMAMTTMALMACQPVTQLNAKEDGLPAIDSLAKTSTIQEVQKLSEQGKIVYLKGKVGKQVPLLGGTAYQLQDRTGTMWIMQLGAAPKPGTEVVIQGKLRRQNIPPGLDNQGANYIEQQKQINKE